jgi:hypothetical protein
MTSRATISLQVMVDVKLNKGVDMSAINDVINGLHCTCVDRSGKSSITGITITGRNLVVDTDEEPDAD